MDNDEVNRFASRLSGDVYSTLDGKKPYLGGGFIPASIQFMSQALAGKKIGATPDGRKAGNPLCDSLGAIFGKDVKGPTALLKSVASLRLEKAVGVPVVNFNIDENWSNDILKALILSYLKMGGIQLQLTCVKAIHLMPYHPMGISKSERLGKKQAYSNKEFLEKSELKPFADMLKKSSDTNVQIM